MSQRMCSGESSGRSPAKDPRVALLKTIPGVGELPGLTIATEVGDIARFKAPEKLVGYSGLTPRWAS